MEIPVTGYVLIPLGLLVVLLPWRFCLIGLTTFAIMSPAAVVNIGHNGLQPGYYLSILLSARTAIEIMTKSFRLNAFVLGRLQLLFYFAIVAFAVLFLALCFFQGQVLCLPGSAGFKSSEVHPYHLSRENFTQLFYLIVNISIVYVMGHQGAKVSLDRLLRAWDIALACALCFAGVICLWQFLALYRGVWFPDDFFYSNAGYNRADSQSLVGLFRINGPFEEPSALGYVMSGYLLYAWLRYRLHPTAFSVGMITVSVLCLLLSTSTTAYVGLALAFAIGLGDVVSGRVKLMNKDFKLGSGQIAAIAVGAAIIIGGGWFLIENANQIGYLLGAVVFHKSDTGSFHERAFADELGIQVFFQTYGLGLGLGSQKANSMLIGLLSNVGIVGVVFFIGFVLTLVRPIRLHSAENRNDESLRTQVRPFQWFLIGMLFINVISSPNLSVMTLWMGIGGIIALQASLHRHAAGLRNLPMGAAARRGASPPSLGGGGAIAA